MNLVYILVIILVAAAMAAVMCHYYKHKFLKDLECMLAVERDYRHKLEDLYMDLYKEYMKHFDIYHR